MKNCEQIQEHINFYDQLDVSTRNTVDKHLAICENCRQHYQTVRQIDNSIKSNFWRNHFDDELLIRYAIYKNDPGEVDYDGQSLNAKQVRAIEDHLITCQHCSYKVNYYVQSYLELENFVEESDIPDITIGTTPWFTKIDQAVHSLYQNTRYILNKIIPQTSFPKYASAAVGLALIILLFWNPFTSMNGQSNYDSLTRIEPITISFQVRSSAGQELVEGFSHFNKKNYSLAARTLRNFLAKNAEHQNQAYVNYVYGLSLLLQAQQNELTQPDQETIDEGIRRLKASLNQTGTNRLKEDILWYLGKAYIIKKDTDQAIEYFKRVIQLDGKRSQDARKLMSKLKRS
ncbi:MAG: outer membrane protein assembly factor BamD [Caldithrix sp.]|nr:outer membrane protein assembly factor BamD [Caldithrix sp.]